MSPATEFHDGPMPERVMWHADRCPVAQALAIVGTRSALLVMREAFFGTTRFDDFAKRVGATDSLVGARLRELTEAGLLEHTPYQEPGQRTRREYRLTQMGRDLFPVILGLYQWGVRYALPDGQAPVELSHQDCGSTIVAEVRCVDGHSVALREIVALPILPPDGSR